MICRISIIIKNNSTRICFEDSLRFFRLSSNHYFDKALDDYLENYFSNFLHEDTLVRPSELLSFAYMIALTKAKKKSVYL